MTIKKGGGRESGVEDEGAGAPWTTTAAPNVGADYPHAAANPAACPDCETFRTIVDPVPSHVHWCHERIRALEAERDTLKLMVRGRDVNLTQHIARVVELETELAFYRGLKDVAELRARAERAEELLARHYAGTECRLLEARVKELKEGIADARKRLYDMRTKLPSAFDWAFLDHGFDFDTRDETREREGD